MKTLDGTIYEFPWEPWNEKCQLGYNFRVPEY